MVTVTSLVWPWLLIFYSAVATGYVGHEDPEMIRIRMRHFKYDPKFTSRIFTRNKHRTTIRVRHFFDTTRSDILEWFRNMPVCIDNGKGSFYRRRVLEITDNMTEFQDKSYILKELGDSLAPAGKVHSKSLYLNGYRFLEDQRNIDMIVKFFDVEVDEHGNELPPHQKLNKKLFAGGNVIFNKTLKLLRPLFVSETYLWDYQGRIPCVVLNFNRIKGDTYESIRQEIAFEIRKIFNKYSYLFRPHQLSKRAQNSFDIYSSGDLTHDELYNAILFVMRSIFKKFRTQILFILNDSADSIIVNYKTSVHYLISDSFANLKLQLLHKYANIVRRNLKLNDTQPTHDDYDGEGDRLQLGDRWKSLKELTTADFFGRKFLQKHRKANRARKDDFPIEGRVHRKKNSFNFQEFQVAGKDLFGGILRGHKT